MCAGFAGEWRSNLVPEYRGEYRAGDEEPLTAKNAEEAAKIAKKYVYRYPLQVWENRFW